MAVDREKILSDLGRAVDIFGEAQNAYDFQSYSNARTMRAEATEILREAFTRCPELKSIFATTWSLLERGIEVEFSDAELAALREVWR